MKKIFLLFVLITAGATAQEKFTIGGGGGILTLDNNDGYNFNVFANYDIGRKTAIGVDAWMAEIDSSDFLAAHLVAELRDTFEFNLGKADFGIGVKDFPDAINSPNGSGPNGEIIFMDFANCKWYQIGCHLNWLWTTEEGREVLKIIITIIALL